MKPNYVKRLKERKDENARLKKRFDEVSFENNAMKAIFAKMGWYHRKNSVLGY